MADDAITVTQEFKREERFIVIKRKHLQPRQLEALSAYLQSLRIRPVEAVVVESDWPEYETVWKMIEDRCSNRTTSLAAQDGLVEALRVAVDAAKVWQDGGDLHAIEAFEEWLPKAEAALASIEVKSDRPMSTRLHPDNPFGNGACE